MERLLILVARLDLLLLGLLPPPPVALLRRLLGLPLLFGPRPVKP